MYAPRGTLFFASATHFQMLFDMQNDPAHITIDCAHLHVADHSAIAALEAVQGRYERAGVSGQAMADELESVRENAATTADTSTCRLRAAENPHVFPIPYADSMILVGFIFELEREFRQLVVSPVEMPWLKGA
ncbi:STAS domain-containing protein [Paraburkholderia sp. EG286B]|uniref:STAS domain-containing protein n=1 Tax=Paraburkholderia sp. EG286B TaxID=3237011 RepID=UPI0034D192A7